MRQFSKIRLILVNTKTAVKNYILSPAEKNNKKLQQGDISSLLLFNILYQPVINQLFDQYASSQCFSYVSLLSNIVMRSGTSHMCSFFSGILISHSITEELCKYQEPLTLLQD